MPRPELRPKASPRERGYTPEYQRKRARALAFLLSRQSGCCWLCHKQIDSKLRYPDPMSPSLDHVNTTRGPGFNAVDNLRAAHFGCNSSRGARER